MSNEYENLAKIILSTPQGSKIIHTIDKLNAFLSTKEGDDMLALLSGGAADAIRSAASAALAEQGDRAKTLVSTLLSYPEGAALAAKTIELMR